MTVPYSAMAEIVELDREIKEVKSAAWEIECADHLVYEEDDYFATR